MRDLTQNQTWRWSLNAPWSQIQSSRGPTKLRIPAKRSIEAELKNRKDTSHVISSHRTKSLSHTGSRLRIAVLRGDSYFTHFEVVRMIRLAAYMLEKTRSCTINDYLHQYPTFSYFFSYKLKREGKNATSDCELPAFIPVNFFKYE